MDRKALKRLAQLSIDGKNIRKEIVDYVLKELKTQELKVYLNFLKDELERNKVYVKVANPASYDLQKKLSEMFPKKELVFMEDSSVGGGILIQNNDNIIDATLKGSVKHAIRAVKEEL